MTNNDAHDHFNLHLLLPLFLPRCKHREHTFLMGHSSRLLGPSRTKGLRCPCADAGCRRCPIAAAEHHLHEATG